MYDMVLLNTEFETAQRKIKRLEIKNKLNENLNAALHNISMTRVRAMRRSILENAWSSRYDAPQGGWNLGFDRRRKEQELEKQRMLEANPNWRVPKVFETSQHKYEGPASSSIGSACRC